ncbi:MAG: bifunctional 1-(5-phosphoribosyl)-5-((5-phosphoribosylamino)methylideneamino)imidazole-4-carboxamide isomerase/phosphoribosylanthranilate isomerase PriA [Propionibacteriaceae bacterium]|jgi:phosphoribosylanthranilate isomerase|nr:bifunctional 1-(5-phosphoribosyl)-5-((5-phosphoribosylamino)methylideneamino)imidazole-4-carboxamide isomerase/phosphoribosylanthranilate isomerase PriA [Propionibacteriaceae bacterium]
MQSGLTIIPAVDIQHGQAVQLVQGVSSSQQVFGDPLEMARRWQMAGASWLHLVDLDAAFATGDNRVPIADIVATTAMRVELTGGIRDDDSLERALSTGCARINIGTAAITNPDWCDRVIAQLGDQVAIALDVRDELLATHGWVEAASDLWSTIRRLNRAGVRRLVVTDTQVDGTMTGPNIDLLSRVCRATDAAVVASGGVSTLADIEALRPLLADGLEGVIIGTALYVEAFSLAQAMAAGTP